MLGKPGKPLPLVQRGVARMQQLSRRVIDVHQHRIKAAARRAGIESIRAMRHREEIAVDETAARIAGQLLAERKQALIVPFDDFGQRVNHDQGSHV